MRFRRAPYTSLLVLLLGLPLTQSASAQSLVRGRLEHAPTGTPVRGAVVELLGTSQERFAATLSDSLGAFYLVLYLGIQGYELAPLEVRGRAQRSQARLTRGRDSFQAHRLLGKGRFLTAEDVHGMNLPAVSHLLLGEKGARSTVKASAAAAS
ncbi:MAG: hypothetical protein WEB88_05350 [Gemmatimonadota bacterium]